MLKSHANNVFPSTQSESPISIVSWKPVSLDMGVYANSGWRAAFISPDFKVGNAFVHSEQFLAAHFLSFLNKRPVSIYGFNTDGGGIDFSIVTKDGEKKKKDGSFVQVVESRSGRTRLVVQNPNIKDYLTLLPNIADFVRQVEQVMGLDESAFHIVKNTDEGTQHASTYAVVSSNVWMESPPLITLFALLLRTGEDHKIGDRFIDTINSICEGKILPNRITDKDLWIRSRAKLGEIINKGYRPFFYINPATNYRSPDISDVINSDWLAFSENAGAIAYWSRKELATIGTIAERRERREKENAAKSSLLEKAAPLVDEARRFAKQKVV